MFPPEITRRSDAESERDVISIGKRRQLVLFCAGFACVFAFVVVAARMFYGTGTTRELTAATGHLKPTPSVGSQLASHDSLADEVGAFHSQTDFGIQQVGHTFSSISTSGQPVPVRPVSTADSYYGHRTSPPTPTGPFSEEAFKKPSYSQLPSELRSAAREQKNSSGQANLHYSILPKHRLKQGNRISGKSNSTKTTRESNAKAAPLRSGTNSRLPNPASKNQIMIPRDQRSQNPPAWSEFPKSREPGERQTGPLFYSELPVHRQRKLNQKNDAAKKTPPDTESVPSLPEIPSLPSKQTQQSPPKPNSQVRHDPSQIGNPPNQWRTQAPKPLQPNRAAASIPAKTISSSTMAPDPSFNSVVQLRPDPMLAHSAHSGWTDPSRNSSNQDMWWEGQIGRSLFPNRQPMQLSLGTCLSIAQTHSPELQVLHSDWYIQQAEAERQAAAFDWSTFVEAIWNRDSAPVGSDLDGATDRLRSRTGNSSFGVRRLTESGAQLEISQQFGTRSGNSTFLNPNPQANSRLGFEYEKPLLRGFGEDYNTSPQKLAVIDQDTAYDRFQTGVQDYLLNVSSAYWTVVLRRGFFLQTKASLVRVEKLAAEMEARIEIDVTPGMIDRAKSEVATRRASLIQAQHEVLQAQQGLLRLIYGADFLQYQNHEVLTLTLPMPQTAAVNAEEKVQAALQQRSEVHQAIREIKAATIRYEVAANEVLPALNLVLTGYVAGLDSNDKIGSAWKRQFQEGEPGVGIGFDFEIPYRNRAAEAAAERQQVTVKRMQAALQTAMADVAEDVRNQVIERNKFGAMLNDQLEAIRRARSMLRNAMIRRENLADGHQVADLYLEDLFQIQSRLETAESNYLQSQVRYTLADNALLRAIAEIDTITDSSSASQPSAFANPLTSTPGQSPMLFPVPDNGIMSPVTSGHSFGQ